jgi:hypothetical protein
MEVMACDSNKLDHALRAVVPERCKPPAVNLLGLFGNNSDLAPNLEITVRIRTFLHPLATFSYLARTPVTFGRIINRRMAACCRRASKGVWFAAFWARCQPGQRPVRHFGGPKGQLNACQSLDLAPQQHVLGQIKPMGATG